MVRTKDLTIAVGLLVLCISGVAAYTLDEALAYSVTGKVCTESESITLAKKEIQDVKNAYQTRAAVQAEIDILKEVRELITKAKKSIIRIDSRAVAFIQTADLSKLRDSGYDEIMDLIEVMNKTTDAVDKVALCDQIITAINEIVEINETLLARDNYDNIPTLLQATIDSIDAFLVKCATPAPVEQEDGSIKIGTVGDNGSTDGGNTNSGNGEGSAAISGDGSIQIVSSNSNGSATVGGNGSAQVNSTTLITVNTSSGNASRKAKLQDGAFVEVKLNASKKSKKHRQQ